MLTKVHRNGLTALRSHQPEHFFQDDSYPDQELCVFELEIWLAVLTETSFSNKYSLKPSMPLMQGLDLLQEGEFLLKDWLVVFPDNGRITGFLINILNIWRYHNCLPTWCYQNYFFVLSFSIFFRTCVNRQKEGSA